MLYLVSLFLHVIGALIYSASLTIEWLCQSKLKKAGSTDKLNDWLGTYSSLPIISGISWLLLLLPGIYMMAVIWKSAAWVTVALVGFIVLILIGSFVTGKRMRPIIKEIKASGYSSDVQSKLGDKMLFLSLKSRTTLTIGIVFLMTIKPGLSDSILTLSVALLLGLLPVKSR